MGHPGLVNWSLYLLAKYIYNKHKSREVNIINVQKYILQTESEYHWSDNGAP